MRNQTRSGRDSPLGRGGGAGPLHIDTLQALLIGTGLLFFLAGVGLALVGGSAGGLPFVGDGGNGSAPSADPAAGDVEPTTEATETETATADETTGDPETTTTTTTAETTTTTTTTETATTATTTTATTTDEQTAPTRERENETDDRDGDDEEVNEETVVPTTTESTTTTANTTTTESTRTTENTTTTENATTTTEESDGIFDVGGESDREIGQWWPVEGVDFVAVAGVFAYEGHNNAL